MLMGHRLVILHEGRSLQVDTPRTIYERPAHRFSASFVGNPPINFLPCRIEAEGDSVRVQPLAADHALGWNTSAEYLPAAWDGRSCQLELAIRRDQVKVALDMRRVSWFDRATGAALPARYQQAGSAHPQGNSPQEQT
jgi:ABC-type sugar transport system ATPase subunit